jgi:hypothetical protein
MDRRATPTLTVLLADGTVLLRLPEAHDIAGAGSP